MADAGVIALVFEVFNATLSKEVIGDDCSASPCVLDEVGPVTLPSLGLEAYF